MLAAPVRLRHRQIVLERGVRLLERVLELVALEDVVVAARRMIVALLRVDRATDGPDRAGLTLDPDDDALVVPRVVHSVEQTLRKPCAVRRDLHTTDYTIARVLRLGSFLRNPFSFLFARSRTEEAVVAYLLREHGAGRRVDDILEDPYVKNRLSAEQQRRMLERADVIHALSEQH